MQFIQSYHRVGQSHADLLVLNVGVVQADRHLHFVKYVKSVLLYLQSWALHTQHIYKHVKGEPNKYQKRNY